jgi:hypothetical protein
MVSGGRLQGTPYGRSAVKHYHYIKVVVFLGSFDWNFQDLIMEKYYLDQENKSFFLAIVLLAST